MSILVNAIAPVAIIIFIGFIAQRTLHFDDQTLSQLTIYILAPALIADSLYRTTLSPQSATGIVVGFLLTTALLYLLVWGITSALQASQQIRQTLIATTLFANVGNLGLPLNTFAYGDAGLERAVIYLTASATLLFGLGPALIKGGGIFASLKLILRLPLFWATVGGVSLRLLNLQLPLRLDTSLQLLGRAAIPIALLILGMQLASTRFALGTYELFASSLRLLIAPAIAYGVGRLLHLEGLDLRVLVLQGAMPVAVNTVVLATEFGGDVSRVARTVILSTLLAFGTLPLVLWLLEQAT